MLKKTLFLILLFCNTSYAEIYKWVDEAGNTHFGDTTRPGAESITLPPIQSYSPPAAEVATNPETTPQESQPDSKKYQLRMLTPVAEETLRNDQGEITLRLETVPELQPGYILRITCDGKTVVEDTALELRIKGIERGEHTLQAELLDPQGQVLATTEKITIYMQRPRVLNPRPKPI